MRLSPTLLGLAALGFGWVSPAFAQDGADCGFLCQIGGYLSSDHMTASPGENGAAAGGSAKAHKPHTAHKGSAKPAVQAAGAPTKPAKPAVQAAATPPRVAPGNAEAKPAAPRPVPQKPVAVQTVATKIAPVDRAAPVAKPPVAEAKAREPKPPGRAVATTAAAAEAGHRAPAAAKPAAPKEAVAEADHPHARPHGPVRAVDRPGGAVEIASISAGPSPGPAPAAPKPVRAARATRPPLQGHRVAPADSDRPVLVLTALAAIPGSAPAMPAGFQPYAAAH